MTFVDYLDSDETLLWTSRPARGAALRAVDIIYIPLSIFPVVLLSILTLIIFAARYENAEQARSLLGFQILLYAFLAFSVAGLFERFIADAFRRSRTYYAVTNKRALIISGFFLAKLRSLPITPELQIRVSGSGRGHIDFGERHLLSWLNGYPNELFSVWRPFAFERIDKVREVYQLVRDVQQGRR